MLNQNELDEIRRKLRELEEEPPVAGWQNIQKELKPRKRWRRFWWVPLALLVLIGTSVLIVQNKKATPNKISLPAPQSAKTTEETRLANKQQMPGLKPNPLNPAPSIPLVNQNNRSNQQSPSIINPSGKKLGFRSGEGTRSSAPRNSQAKSRVFSSDLKQEKADDQVASGIFKKSPALEAPVADKNNPAKDSLLTNRISTNPLPADSLAQKTTPDSTSTATKKQESALKKLAPAPKPVPPGFWTLGLFFAPRYAFRTFTPDTRDEILITRVNPQDTLGARRMGYEFGLNLAKAISTKLHLEASFSLMQLKENIAYSFTTGTIDSSTITSEQAPDGSVTVTNSGYIVEDRRLVSTYTYGGLRLGTTYYLNSAARHRYSLTFAAGANLLVKGQTKQLVNNLWIETITFPSPKNILEQSNYNLLFGAGYHVPLGPKYEFMVMPAINYFLGSTFKKREPFGLRPYSLGITFQLKRIFQK